MNKNSKSKSVAAPSTSLKSFATRLSKSGGRIVGVTTVSNNKVRKMNGQVKSVGATYATIYDRNKKQNIRFALNTILNVTGV